MKMDIRNSDMQEAIDFFENIEFTENIRPKTEIKEEGGFDQEVRKCSPNINSEPRIFPNTLF